ncbi:hypothetical protein B0T19DRAFT_251149 [Cercophora scortea]|uniref:Uncharacterized protein n=1 Tax=Cercophora scortea TaxID=314031 RepID=A0AAE0I9A1_9PEZI|nr:hypothetical protein B0T19DRAFT_251149 [Cercophora scortea]
MAGSVLLNKAERCVLFVAVCVLSIPSHSSILPFFHPFIPSDSSHDLEHTCRLPVVILASGFGLLGTRVRLIRRPSDDTSPGAGGLGGFGGGILVRGATAAATAVGRVRGCVRAGAGAGTGAVGVGGWLGGHFFFCAWFFVCFSWGICEFGVWGDA